MTFSSVFAYDFALFELQYETHLLKLVQLRREVSWFLPAILSFAVFSPRK